MDIKKAYSECLNGSEEHKDAAWHEFVGICLQQMKEKYPDRKYEKKTPLEEAGKHGG